MPENPITPRQERLITAAHEAGHAMVAALLGVPLERAKISHRLFSQAVDGVVTAEDQLFVIGRYEDKFDHYAVIALAGPEAEAYWRHKTEDADLAEARAVAFEAARNSSEADVNNARRCLRKGSGQLSLGQARSQARQLVMRHWTAITRTAEALDKHTTLNGSRLHTLAAKNC